MLDRMIEIVDQKEEQAKKTAMFSTEKRSDQWSMLLVSVAETRDRRAFTQLFNHFAPLLKSFAQASRHEGWFPGLSEDLVQEVMIKVWQKSASYNPEKASATTWIYTVARNCRIDMLRRKSNTQHLPLDNEDFWHEADEDTPVTLMRQKRSEDKVQTSLAKLPKEQDEILRKVYLEGKSHAEASNELGLPLGTVKSRVRLALQKMQILVAPEFRDDVL
ncbi:MAG: sigma-70 family RNA polymerase sigma factor [Porticoccaceae bacterium]|nr:sigma-70 family RNA polymerase sigma factor [Porticoccaceae bacterium]|tara:strand:+ start:14626 stop:15279 length:654 start_codon:yes stop_codon:yes gene_type:complete